MTYRYMYLTAVKCTKITSKSHFLLLELQFMSISRRTSDECFLAIYKLPILIDRDLYGLTKPVELHWETRLFLRIVMIESRTVC